MRATYLTISNDQRSELDTLVCQAKSQQARQRYQALLCLASGMAVYEVAVTVGCCPASVYHWLNQWERGDTRELAAGDRCGRPRKLAAAAAQLLDSALCQGIGQSATVPALQRRLDEEGVHVSQATIRRTIHRLGWCWRAGRYVLEGRSVSE